MQNWQQDIQRGKYLAEPLLLQDRLQGSAPCSQFYQNQPELGQPLPGLSIRKIVYIFFLLQRPQGSSL